MRSPKTTRGEEAALMKRLVGCMPASKFEMQTLCRLAGIKATRSLPSAAVECTRRPRLLINPDFVKKYCKRDEHLFMMVMHEIWHVMLAHTRMYPRMTSVQNIAFDAIINAGLMREFNRPEYRGFFEAINPADKFPHCLLRPPEGWPNNPVYPEDIGPPGTKGLLMRLYPPRFIRRHSAPLYEEVLSLLLKSGMVGVGDGPFLLGNHDGQPTHDPIIKDVIREAMQKWPKIDITGQGEGGPMGHGNRGLKPTGEGVRRVFSRTLRLCLGRKPGREVRKAKTPIPTMMGTGVLPNARDRLAPARRMLGAQSTLWAQPGEIKARIPERPSKAYVYLDVSGSMNYILPYLLGLLLPYVRKGRAEVFQFSTEIAAMSLADLRQGKINTTGGTNINCVLEHVLKVTPRVERLLLLTDGVTGAPTTQLAQALSEHNLRMNVVLPNNGNLHYAVQQLATSVVTLPPLN